MLIRTSLPHSAPSLSSPLPPRCPMRARSRATTLYFRAKIPPPPRPRPRGNCVQSELRPSFLFSRSLLSLHVRFFASSPRHPSPLSAVLYLPSAFHPRNLSRLYAADARAAAESVSPSQDKREGGARGEKETKWDPRGEDSRAMLSFRLDHPAATASEGDAMKRSHTGRATDAKEAREARTPTAAPATAPTSVGPRAFSPH